MESYTIIDNDFYSDRNLDPYEKTVLSYLIRYYNFNFGYSFPTREQIQHDNNISPSKLTKTLKSLQEKGYITIKNNHKKAGRNKRTSIFGFSSRQQRLQSSYIRGLGYE